MKLILCTECHDIVRLIPNDTRKCLCGKSGGRYTDELNAVIFGPSIPLGINNRSLRDAIVNRPEAGRGTVFHAFVIPELCETIKREN